MATCWPGRRPGPRRGDLLDISMDTGHQEDSRGLGQLVERGRADHICWMSRIQDGCDCFDIHLDSQGWGFVWQCGVEGTVSQTGLVDSRGLSRAQLGRHGFIPGCPIGGVAIRRSPSVGQAPASVGLDPGRALAPCPSDRPCRYSGWLGCLRGLSPSLAG